MDECKPLVAGRFLWTVNNFALFREMIKTQKVMSPCFPAGDCNFRLSVYQSTVNGSARLILPDSSRHPTHVELSVLESNGIL